MPVNSITYIISSRNKDSMKPMTAQNASSSWHNDWNVICAQKTVLLLALVTCASCTALPSEHQTLFNQELHVPWEQYMSTWNSFSANTVRELALWTHEWPSKCCQCHVVLTRPPAPEYVLIMHFGHRWENASVSAYLTKCGLAVTSIFDLLTSKLN